MAEDILTGDKQGDPAGDPSPAPATDPLATDPPATDPPATDPPATDPPATEDPPKEGEVPESYADFTLPEGMKLDTVALESYAPAFKELGLSQEQAQKLVDLRAAEVNDRTAKTQAFITERDAQWDKDLKGDKEFGGEHYSKTVQAANQLLATFGGGADGDVVAFLKEAGAQNCAPLVRMLARMAPHFKEDDLVTAGGGTKSAKNQPSYMKMGYKPIDDY